MKKVVRVCEISNIPFNVRVEHNHLNKSDRVENSEFSDEVFLISVYVEWLSEPKLEGFEGLFNYAELYKYIQSCKSMTLDKPLEHILDLISEKCYESAHDQKIEPIKMKISLDRPGIIDGGITMQRIS